MSKEKTANKKNSNHTQISEIWIYIDSIGEKESEIK